MKGKECLWTKSLGRYGSLLIRVVVGLIFLFAGYSKLFGTGGLFDAGASAGLVSMLGWLGSAALFFAWLVAIIEFVGGISFIAGIFDEYVASLLGVIMLVAIITVHWNTNSFMAWWNSLKYQLLLLVIFIKYIGARGCCGILKFCKN